MKMFSKIFKLYSSRSNSLPKEEIPFMPEVDTFEEELKRKKLLEESIESRKRIDFNYKMSNYLSNPYKYPLSTFSIDINMSQDELLLNIAKNENLSMRYNHIIFSRKTTAEELYNQLLISIPPEFETTEKYNLAIENPAFRVVFFYYLYEAQTVDYFKLQSEMNLSDHQIHKVFEVYINKSDELIKSIKVKREMDNWRFKNDIADYL